MTVPAALPRVRLLPGADRRVKAGQPWIYSNEIAMDQAARGLSPGATVTVTAAGGRPIGTAGFNYRSLIAARLFGREPDMTIDRVFLARKLEAALALRRRLIGGEHYRLVHADADGLPGLILDRFGQVAVAQLNTATMDMLRPELEAAIRQVLAPDTLVLRCESGVRALEGLETYTAVLGARLDDAIAVEENGLRYFADLVEGQKTGWFFDQRRNRALVAGLAEGARVLDVYCHTGGFAVAAAAAEAESVLGIDRSAPALALAARAAQANGVATRCRFEREDAFGALDRMAAEGVRFDLAIADPPAFVKTKKDLAAGSKGYARLAAAAARLVAPRGLLFLASCSHPVDAAQFLELANRGLVEAGRQARLLRAGGADLDHPVHPALPQTAYLKSLLLALD
ncbi:MAG: class I SAM-dependent rRNA methyltransferase [Alphaproteobacteria bacterium]|nr:class I SAM-dependent rRNA methyltransferase [Alphaproteobacteria bacterium]